MTDTTPSPQAATLHGHGRIAWAALAPVLAAAGGTAWADYHGFHIGAPPARLPAYTHLWAWHADWLLRARLDGEYAIAGTLQLGPAIPDLARRESWTVHYTLRRAHTWAAGERRIGPLAPAVSGRAVCLYEIAGPHPVSFVSVQ